MILKTLQPLGCLSLPPRTFRAFSVCQSSYRAISCVQSLLFSLPIMWKNWSLPRQSLSYVCMRSCSEQAHKSAGSEETDSQQSRVLNIAIIGVPNAGKSTVINFLVGRKVCPISSKVHTTRSRARAIVAEDNTQLIFLDTPGLVTTSESERHKLEPSFMADGESAMAEADVIGVVHDVSNNWTNHTLNPKVLRLLHLYAQKDAILILNKIDTIKSKRKLLDLSRVLTCDKLASGEERPSPRLSEGQVTESISKQKGWPHFSEVFFVSALTESGMGDLKEYFLRLAQPGPWLYEPTQFTDQIPESVIVQTVRARLLDYLPNEVPYNLTTRMEFYDVNRNGVVISVVLVECPTPRLERLVVGSKGSRIRKVAREAEQDLYATFQQPVHLKVCVTGPSSGADMPGSRQKGLVIGGHTRTPLSQRIR